jgi:alkylation response protein AidB-like acyl-CoA dehydrogenase
VTRTDDPPLRSDLAATATEVLRAEVRSWLAANLVGEFAEVGGVGGPGSEHLAVEVRRRWERLLGRAGWIGLGWPVSAGGRGATVDQQMVWHEEYAAAGAPARVGVVGEGLLGPTLIAFGTDAQRRRFLPGILEGTELWCQGYSEPDAGSDLANVQTKAVLDGGRWVVTGRKVWTSLAHWADWCFVLCRTVRGSTRHRGLSYLLVPMAQPGVEVRPIRQLTGTAEFNEVTFDEAVTDADLVVGQPGEGWKVALATLGFERGAGLLGHIVHFRRELAAVLAVVANQPDGPDLRLRLELADAWARLELFGWHVQRTFTGQRAEVAAEHQAGDGSPLDAGAQAAASMAKLFWSTWHRRLGELACDVLGPAATAFDADTGSAGSPGAAAPLVRSFLASRADTIYGGTNEIQRNLLAERVLGLPAEPRPATGSGAGAP